MKNLSTEKIELDEIIKDFQIKDLEAFSLYLLEIWRDLSSRSADSLKGIERLTFSQYYELPGIISERLFNVFDENSDDFIEVKEFLNGMTCLFSESFDKLSNFIFKFYDFDKDGFITKEDVRIVLSYVPLNIKYTKGKMKYEKENFQDRVDSQNELYEILNKAFGKKEKLTQEDFINVVDNVTSDIFIFILMFLLEKRPFSEETVKIFLKNKKMSNQSKTPKFEPHKIASPSMKSKFMSPSLKKRTVKMGERTGILSKYAGKAKTSQQKNEQVKETSTTDDSNSKPKQHPHRRMRKLLDNLEENVTKSTFSMSVKKSNEQPIKDIDNDFDKEDEAPPLVKHEGFMYKVTHSKKLKLIYFKLIGKDFYFFKNKEDQSHKGMHNLSGIYIEKGDIVQMEGKKLFSFSMLYPNKARTYYIEDSEEFKEWMHKLHLAIDYKNLLDQYIVQEKAGKGKFGLVKIAKHKETQRTVAIKIMSKKNMSKLDLNLAKTEIDILKISQHPNIIKLYDVFDTAAYIYIVMEYCGGGDLFSFIESRGYRLSEAKACEIIHKLSMAVYYIHSYGIVHRDLKPENILMTDTSDNADIRLLDFGLSKIIGPTETCTEPFGTLSYVAPEVLTEEPYGKEVDLWSIGIITYLLLCGFLPFDDENSDREIARQTIQDPVPYPSKVWSKLSPEAKKFVDALLQKKPKERMTITQVLEHEWIKKYSKVPEFREKSNKKRKSLFSLYAADKIDS